MKCTIFNAVSKLNTNKRKGRHLTDLKFRIFKEFHIRLVNNLNLTGHVLDVCIKILPSLGLSGYKRNRNNFLDSNFL